LAFAEHGERFQHLSAESGQERPMLHIHLNTRDTHAETTCSSGRVMTQRCALEPFQVDWN